MLHIEAKIHDRLTLEYKVGNSHDADPLPVSDFVMNTWVFVPDALYINPKTYPKSEFYRDVRSQVRLMTPVYGLHELVEADAPPFVRLEETCARVVDEEEGEAVAADLEHRLKMLACVVRSALRSRVRALELERDAERCLSLLEETLSDLEQVEHRMRRPFEGADRGRMPEGVLGAASVADRYVGAMALYYLSRLSERLYGRFATCRGRIEALLGAYFDRAALRRAALGQPFPAPGAGADAAGAWLDEVAALRREVERDLYLEARKRNNTFVARQVAFMVAAGLSMVFATLVSFSFQQTYGNFTLPLFVALVVSYMMKDRIKDLFDVEPDLEQLQVPSFLIQPLVENAIVHGIQPCKGKGVVTISVAECGNRVRIAVRDTGHGIDPKVIERVESNEMPGNKIGLLNVHHRVKLLYGEGLHIRRLEPGTEIAFYVPNQHSPAAAPATLLL